MGKKREPYRFTNTTLGDAVEVVISSGEESVPKSRSFGKTATDVGEGLVKGVRYAQALMGAIQILRSGYQLLKPKRDDQTEPQVESNRMTQTPLPSYSEPSYTQNLSENEALGIIKNPRLIQPYIQSLEIERDQLQKAGREVEALMVQRYIEALETVRDNPSLLDSGSGLPYRDRLSMIEPPTVEYANRTDSLDEQPYGLRIRETLGTESPESVQSGPLKKKKKEPTSIVTLALMIISTLSLLYLPFSHKTTAKLYLPGSVNIILSVILSSIILVSIILISKKESHVSG